MPQYDEIAAAYQVSKQLPFRIYVEAPLLQSLLGDVSGKNVLDLACGEGIYSRALRAHGAKQVVGVDLSSEMIALAEAQEKKNPLGIKYVVADASTVGVLGEFDLVVGSYLLNYARSAAHLKEFCQVIANNLKPGGRFVGVNDNPANAPENYHSYKHYGFVKVSPSPRREGDPVRYEMRLENGDEFAFDNYYLAPQTYERVFADVGLRKLTWHKPKVVPAGIEKMGEAYWQAFCDDPPIIGMVAERSY